MPSPRSITATDTICVSRPARGASGTTRETLSATAMRTVTSVSSRVYLTALSTRF